MNITNGNFNSRKSQKSQEDTQVGEALFAGNVGN